MRNSHNVLALTARFLITVYLNECLQICRYPIGLSATVLTRRNRNGDRPVVLEYGEIGYGKVQDFGSQKSIMLFGMGFQIVFEMSRGCQNIVFRRSTFIIK